MLYLTYSILQDKTATIIAELTIDYSSGSIVCRMFLGLSRGDVEGVFRNLGRKTVVCSKSFL